MSCCKLGFVCQRAGSEFFRLFPTAAAALLTAALCPASPLQVLGIVVGVLIQDHDVRQTEFQQLPYHRIFIMLLLELNAPEHVLETINFQTLTAFW